MATILLTGASSFTGLWIAEALARGGHRVTAPLRRPLAAYDGLRLDRVRRLQASAEVVFDCPFASPGFLDLARGGWDLLAHHAADIPGYRSPDYDAEAGFRRNTEGAAEAMQALAAGGLGAVAVTGTVFEPGEGTGPGSEQAVSPYGLSKGLTNALWRDLAQAHGVRFGKFVIANPFGPLEEGRLVWSLFQAWFEGRPGLVRTPAYVRDNIPAPQLAAAYAKLAADLLAGGDGVIARPSGYVAPQGLFARKVAAEVEARLGRPCPVETALQAELAEPYLRVNCEPWLLGDWGEAAFWDAYVAYYEEVAARGLLAATPA